MYIIKFFEFFIWDIFAVMMLSQFLRKPFEKTVLCFADTQIMQLSRHTDDAAVLMTAAGVVYVAA